MGRMGLLFPRQPNNLETAECAKQMPRPRVIKILIHYLENIKGFDFIFKLTLRTLFPLRSRRLNTIPAIHWNVQFF